MHTDGVMSMPKPKPTGATPITVGGYTFRCYSAGRAGQYKWLADDTPDMLVRHNYGNSSTAAAYYAGKCIGERYLTLRNAMKAAVRAKESDDA